MVLGLKYPLRPGKSGGVDFCLRPVQGYVYKEVRIVQ